MDNGTRTARQPSLTTEVEAPPQSPRTYFNDPGASRFFPIELFKCCPIGAKALIPSTVQKIQDETHLILVVGAAACTLLVVQTIISLLHFDCADLICMKELLAIVFIVPCTTYCIRIIGQYDERLTTKQRDCKEQKDNLTKTYNCLLTDMDGLLSKSAESSAGLAERSFESKRRDFQRFLERVKNKYSSLYSGTKGDSDKLLKQFRRFCVNWLGVFEECSIDPIQCPKRVVTAEELNRCTSIAEVADLCLERLRMTEVRFISIQRDQDAQMLRKNRNELTRLTLALPSISAVQLAQANSRQQAKSAKRVSWFTVGAGQGWGWRSTRNGLVNDFPKECSFGCGRLVVLSREHLLLISGFCVGWAILLLQLLHVFRFVPGRGTQSDSSSYVTIAEVLIAEICLMTMLLKFEEIDLIQQLEREVKLLAKQNEQVAQQRQKMREFWSNAQQLTELWLYRTVPRLDLFKEVHSLLEDTEDDLLMKISSANQQLEDLEKHLCPLRAWRGDGPLGIDDKKYFGKMINELCQQQELDGILVKLEDVSRSGMKCLLPAPPASFASGKEPEAHK